MWPGSFFLRGVGKRAGVSKVESQHAIDLQSFSPVVLLDCLSVHVVHVWKNIQFIYFICLVYVFVTGDVYQIPERIYLVQQIWSSNKWGRQQMGFHRIRPNLLADIWSPGRPNLGSPGTIYSQEELVSRAKSARGYGPARPSAGVPNPLLHRVPHRNRTL